MSEFMALLWEVGSALVMPMIRAARAGDANAAANAARVVAEQAFLKRAMREARRRK